MFDNSSSVDSFLPLTSSNLERYRSIDILSLNDACALIVSCDPALVENDVELESLGTIPLINQFFIPSSYISSSNASEIFSDNLKLLKNAVRHKVIAAQVVYIKINLLTSEDDIDSERTTIMVKDLKDWLANRNFYPSFFFPDGDENDFMNPKNTHYAPKLALCVAAWQAAQMTDISGQTVKQFLMKWMMNNAMEYGVENAGESFFNDLATIPNWDSKGGKPSQSNTPPIKI